MAEDALPEVVASPPLAHGLGALPRLQGDGPAVARINATLEGVDALPMALDCWTESAGLVLCRLACPTS